MQVSFSMIPDLGQHFSTNQPYWVRIALYNDFFLMVSTPEFLRHELIEKQVLENNLEEENLI